MLLNFNRFSGLILLLAALTALPHSLVALTMDPIHRSMHEKTLAMITSLEANGALIDCLKSHTQELTFEFSLLSVESTRKNIKKGTFCDELSKYHSFVYEELWNYWPLDQNIGISLSFINESDPPSPWFAGLFAGSAPRPYLKLPVSNRRNFESQKNMIAHEYGHAVFEDILISALEKNGDLNTKFIENYHFLEFEMMEKSSEYRQLSESIQKNHKDLKSDSTSGLNFLALRKKNAELLIKKATMQRDFFIERGFQRLPSVSTIMVFHEFFADLFAAFFFDNPNVNGEGLAQLLGLKREHLSVQSRMFSPINPDFFLASTWQNQNSTPHGFLAPTRAAFDTSLISRLKKKGLGPLYLKKVRSHLVEKIVQLTKSPNGAEFYSYPQIIKNFERMPTTDRKINMLFGILQKNIIDSAFMDNQHLMTWCESEAEKCMEFTMAELKKEKLGVFRTSLNLRNANLYLIQDLNLLAHRVLIENKN